MLRQFRLFLESSTIHGLSYISSSRSLCGKIFWLFVVLTGFTCALLLIHQSFDSWNQSPIKTTIENRPIEEIHFPKVTVCPPRNTFTNLNYDLMNMSGNWVFTAQELSETFHSLYEDHRKSVLQNFRLTWFFK